MKVAISSPEPRISESLFSTNPKQKALFSDYSQRVVSPARWRDIHMKRDALGVQLAVDLHDCATKHLDDLVWVKQVMIDAAKRANATIVESVFHKFNPIGISGVVVIAESHLAVHIWPEHRYAAVDIFSCGTTLKAAAAAQFLIKQFRSSRPVVVEMQRGLLHRKENGNVWQNYSA